MTHEEFTQKQAAMPDQDLLKQCSEALSKLCQTGGRSFTMTIPVRLSDTDVLLYELIRRYQALQWIPVSDKHPPRGEDLLIWDGSVRGRGYLNIDGNWVTVSFEGKHEITDRKITHYMPLPKPPQH